DDGQLLIKLEGGSMLKALAATGMNLAAGERLVLQVCTQGIGKTQMQILARDGGAGRSANTRDGIMRPPTVQVGADAGKNTGNAMQAADDDAVMELCRLVSETPGIGKALQKMMQSLMDQPASANEAVLPRVQENIRGRTAGFADAGTEASPMQEQSLRARPETAQNVQKQIPVQIEPQNGGVCVGTVPERAAALLRAAAAGPIQAPVAGETAALQDAEIDPAGAARDNVQSAPGTGGAAVLAKPQGTDMRQGVPEQVVPAENTKAAASQKAPVSHPVRESVQNEPAAPLPAERPDLRETLIRDVKAMFVRPDAQDFDGESLKRQIESLNERMAELGQKAALAGGDGKAIGNQLEACAAQARQVEHIQQFTYLQIPVMLREKESTAELYVFHRDKRGKPIDPGATVVMLVLDTQCMGKVESVVRAENKNVHIQMRVENERVAQMFEGKAAILDRELAEAGYRLTQMACRLIDAPATPQNAPEIALNLLRDGTRRLDVVI
ncbi:MAG: flagellar hook-length control protein FliK, partial [Bacillota bacterium]